MLLAAEARHRLDEAARIDRFGQMQMKPGLQRQLAIFLARE